MERRKNRQIDEMETKIEINRDTERRREREIPPLFDPSPGLLCHPCITANKLS